MSRLRFKQNIYFVAIGQVAQKLLAFALIPFAARDLGDVGFGQFSLASALMFVIVLLNDWGMSTYLTREIARKKDQLSFFFWNALSLKIFLVVFDFLILLLYLRFANYTAETNRAILIFAAYGITSSLMQLTVGVYEAFEKMEFEAIVLTLEKIIITGLGIYALRNGYGLLPFCAVFVIGGLASFLISFVLVKIYFPITQYPVSVSGTRKIFMNSLPFGLSLLFATIYNYTGIFVLSLMKTSEEVGWFSAGFKLINITNLIPLILCGAIYPLLSRELHQEHSLRIKNLYSQGFKYLFFLALPMIVGVMLLADRLIPFIFGDEFLSAVPTLRIMVLTAALVFFNLYFTSVLKAANYQKTMVRVQGFALAMNIIVNVVLISLLSFQGAAWATVCTELFIFSTYLIMIQKRVTRLERSGFWLKGIGATLVMGFFIRYFGSLHIILLMGLSILLYFPVLYLFRGFTLSEIIPYTRNQEDKTA